MMLKPRNGPALFDLLTDSGNEITEPLTQKRRRLEMPPSEVLPREMPTVDRNHGIRVVGVGENSGVPGGRLPGGSRQLQLTLSTWMLAGIVVVALLLVAGTFESGRRVGRSAGLKEGFQQGRASFATEATSEIEVARQQAPAPEIIAELIAPTSGTKEVAATSAGRSKPSTWVSGYTYVVVQEFSKGHEEDAKAAQAYLADHGIDSVVVSLTGGGSRLMTTQGYNHDDAEQKRLGDDLLRKIRTIGGKYFASGGRYKLEGYFKKLTGESWS